MAETYNDPELGDILRALAKHISDEVKDAESRYGWTLMVVSLSTGEAGFTGNGDRDAMLEVFKRAIDKATKEADQKRGLN